jgi:predicted nucleic acid-binding protein
MARNKCFVETSVFIRFYTKDHEDKYKDCLQLFKLIESGKITPYTSNIVVQEIIYILTRHYKFPVNEVLSDVRTIFKLRNIKVIEKTDTLKAINLFEKFKIKLGDAFIATQIPKGVTLVTYDKDFKKIKGLSVATPGEIVKQFDISL